MDAIPRKQKWNKTEWAQARKRALATLDPVCAICHKYIDLEAPAFSPIAVEVDHIVPETRGGSDELSNLRLVCTRANEAKGNMMDDEFLELCRNVIRKSSGGQS